MRKIGLILAGAFILATGPACLAAIQTVDHVDLDRYVGDWYEIAHIPRLFEGGKCVCTRQRLTPMESGQVHVYNSCNARNHKGRLRDIEGVATGTDPRTNSKFAVDFGLPWKGTYWIIGLDPQYRFAVVTDRRGRSLYILSKQPTLSPGLYNQAVALAARQVDLSRLEMTDQRQCSYPR